MLFVINRRVVVVDLILPSASGSSLVFRFSRRCRRIDLFVIGRVYCSSLMKRTASQKYTSYFISHYRSFPFPFSLCFFFSFSASLLQGAQSEARQSFASDVVGELDRSSTRSVWLRGVEGDGLTTQSALITAAWEAKGKERASVVRFAELTLDCTSLTAALRSITEQLRVANDLSSKNGGEKGEETSDKRSSKTEEGRKSRKRRAVEKASEAGSLPSRASSERSVSKAQQESSRIGKTTASVSEETEYAEEEYESDFESSDWENDSEDEAEKMKDLHFNGFPASPRPLSAPRAVRDEESKTESSRRKSFNDTVLVSRRFGKPLFFVDTANSVQREFDGLSRELSRASRLFPGRRILLILDRLDRLVSTADPFLVGAIESVVATWIQVELFLQLARFARLSVLSRGSSL